MQTRRLFTLFSICWLGLVQAQGSNGPSFNWRGTIAAFDGQVITVQLKDGQRVDVAVPPTLPVSITLSFGMADIRPGQVLGVTTLQRADGATVAIDVRPIPASAPKGLSPHDLQPMSTMTNGVLEASANTADAQTLILALPSGSVKVLVPPGTPMSQAAPGTRTDLKPGETVFIASRRTDAGGFVAQRLQVSKDGVKPTQ